MADAEPRLQAWRLPAYAEWTPTRHLAHMAAQMMGKCRLALAPKVNHWWHVGLHATPGGLTTLAMPYGERALQVDLDLRAHRLVFRTSAPDERVVPLETTSVAALHQAFQDALDGLGMPVRTWPVPVEVAEPVPFAEDDLERRYVPEHALALADDLWHAHRLLARFRAGFIGKSSPLLFFWGGFDLALTRFSGRLAVPHDPVPGVAYEVVAEAYSHEVASMGWWPGNDAHPEPAFFAYAYPEPAGYRGWAIEPPEARYDAALHEFILDVRALEDSASPDDDVLRFFASAYEAAAELAEWNRLALEAPPATRAPLAPGARSRGT